MQCFLSSMLSLKSLVSQSEQRQYKNDLILLKIESVLKLPRFFISVLASEKERQFQNQYHFRQSRSYIILALFDKKRHQGRTFSYIKPALSTPQRIEVGKHTHTFRLSTAASTPLSKKQTVSFLVRESLTASKQLHSDLRG